MPPERKIGPYGFGNPAPVYKYRFVLEQVTLPGA
jgi:hypothetical protein